MGTILVSMATVALVCAITGWYELIVWLDRKMGAK